MSEIKQINDCIDGKSAILKIVSLTAYTAFLTTFVYYMFFLTGLVVPVHIDNINPAPLVEGLVMNGMLVLLFGVQHTVMASKGYKAWFAENFNPAWERTIFVAVSTITFMVMMTQWRSHGMEVWSVDGVAAYMVWGLYVLGWVVMLTSTFLIDHFHLFGLRQAFDGMFPGGHDGFVTPLFYKLVRHPMMTGVIILLWSTPHMTIGHLVMAAGLTIYTVVGIRFEEDKLVDELGQEYENYRRTTPALVPGLKPIMKPANK